MTTALGAALVVVAAGSASAGDKDQYTLFNPTPVDKMRAFNTDRPTKSNVPYTVDAGHFQYEGDLFIYGYDNISTHDTNITSWTVGNPTFKLGLLNNVDFEVNFSFYNSIRSATVSTGAYTIAGLAHIEVKIDRVDRDERGEQGGRAAGGPAAGDQVADRDEMGADAAGKGRRDAGVIQIELRVANECLGVVDPRLAGAPVGRSLVGGFDAAVACLLHRIGPESLAVREVK